MLRDISPFTTWRQHLQARLIQANELGLLHVANLDRWRGGNVFVPSQLAGGDIGSIDPRTALSNVRVDSAVDNVGWKERPDLFDEAARWIRLSFPKDCDAWLICEGGYSAVGDKVLEKRNHIVHGGRPLLLAKISEAESDELATVLRWGRSWRSLVVATSGPISRLPIEPSASSFFLCDAFDGDSLIVARLESNESG